MESFKQLSDLLVLDIETVPAVPAFTDLDPHWQTLFRNKLAKTVPEGSDPADLYRKKAGILAEFGRIICISTAFFTREQDPPIGLRIQNIAGHEEVEILRSFTEVCRRMESAHPGFRFAGHNIREFDIPFICRRFLALGLSLPASLQFHDKKPWEIPLFDTMGWWKFGDIKNYVSLDLLANVLRIPSSKSDMDGSQVQDVYYRDKNLDRIIAYCQQDVITTARIILRFLAQPDLPDRAVFLPEGSRPV
ncbi:MAG TPA: ribonuclease H-like domain-containing protein [Sediminibacterium sp.]|nr:ribonuclease H-like domain-containing protein [Sediminibacterium sp.]